MDSLKPNIESGCKNILSAPHRRPRVWHLRPLRGRTLPPVEYAQALLSRTQDVRLFYRTKNSSHSWKKQPGRVNPEFIVTCRTSKDPGCRHWSALLSLRVRERFTPTPTTSAWTCFLGRSNSAVCGRCTLNAWSFSDGPTARRCRPAMTV